MSFPRIPRGFAGGVACHCCLPSGHPYIALARGSFDGLDSRLRCAQPCQEQRTRRGCCLVPFMRLAPGDQIITTVFSSRRRVTCLSRNPGPRTDSQRGTETASPSSAPPIQTTHSRNGQVSSCWPQLAPPPLSTAQLALPTVRVSVTKSLNHLQIISVNNHGGAAAGSTNKGRTHRRRQHPPQRCRCTEKGSMAAQLLCVVYFLLIFTVCKPPPLRTPLPWR